MGCGPCADGERCIDDRCVLDRDGDGVPADRDCDDDGPTVGSTAERTCGEDNPCGSGVQRCQDGVWSACDAPTDCECNASDPERTIDCGMCGSRIQACQGGEWVDQGECVGAGECMPGTELDETRTCCGGGTQTRTRTCTDACTFDEPEWSPCSTAQCTPGDVQIHDDVACGQCNRGRQTVTQTCDPDGCGWTVTHGPCEGAGPVCIGSETETEYCECEWGVRQYNTYRCCPDGVMRLGGCWGACG